jgi:transcriptional regulator with XRE-family HTH domain
MKQPRNLLTQPDLGRRLAETRKRLGWTQTALQELLGLDRRVTISDWETGKEAIPPERLAQIASLAGASVEGVFGDRAGTVPERARATTGGAYDEAVEEERRQLTAIGRIADPWARMLERDSLAAVIRAQAARDACRALRVAEEVAAARALPDGRIPAHLYRTASDEGQGGESTSSSERARNNSA